MPATNEAAHHWVARLQEFAFDHLTRSPVLREALGGAAVLLHGSTTLGIDDDAADLDVWILTTPETLATFDASAPTRLIEFEIDARPGHFTLESKDDFAARIRACDLQLISELRPARIVYDPDEWAAGILRVARRPMNAQVRLAWFRHHYIEMRSEHRAAGDAVERGDALALLQSATAALTHALRAALVLDGEPYPCATWLARAAAATPTGAQVVALAEDVVDLLGTGALRAAGERRAHPLSLKLREVRRVLIDAARAAGIDGVWLDHWPMHLAESRAGVREVAW